MKVSFRTDTQGQFMLAVVVVGFLLLNIFPVQQWISSLANIITIVTFYHVIRQGESANDIELPRDTVSASPEEQVQFQEPVSEARESHGDSHRTETESSTPGLYTVWIRGDSTRASLLHQYCSLSVFDDSDTDGGSDPSLTICSGTIRWLLRHTPLIILVITAFFIVHGEVSPSAVGLSAFIRPTVPPLLALLLSFTIATVLLLVAFAIAFTPLSRRGIAKATVVYGLIVALSGTVVLTQYLITTAEDPRAIPVGEASILFSSGFLLTLLIGGLLVYDLILRAEMMITCLPQKSPSVIRDPTRYRSFVNELNRALNAPLIELESIQVPVAYAFAGVWVLPGFVVSLFLSWSALGVESVVGLVFETLTTLILTGIDFVITVVFFQFLVLLSFGWRLLRQHESSFPVGEDEPMLEYVPFHPDNHSGFADFGRFAVRITLILIVTGFYEVYRLWVPGSIAFPVFGALSSSFEVLLWVITYPLPLLVYFLVFIAWLYLSFWQLHRVMKRAKSMRMSRLFECDDTTLTEKQRVKETGAEWPTSWWVIAGLVVAGIVPLLVSGFFLAW